MASHFGWRPWIQKRTKPILKLAMPDCLPATINLWQSAKIRCDSALVGATSCDWAPMHSTSGSGLGRVKTPTCNLRVEIPSRFRQLENQKHLRPLLGEDDRENNSAHSWLVHVFTQPGSFADIGRGQTNVRWSPEGGHQPNRSVGPLCAIMLALRKTAREATDEYAPLVCRARKHSRS